MKTIYSIILVLASTPLFAVEVDMGMHTRDTYSQFEPVTEAYLRIERPAFPGGVIEFFHSSILEEKDNDRGYNHLGIGFKSGIGKIKSKAAWSFYSLVGVIDESDLTDRENPVAILGLTARFPYNLALRIQYVHAIEGEYNTGSMGFGLNF